MKKKRIERRNQENRMEKTSLDVCLTGKVK
jgi:hypothetical protein